MTGGEVSGPGAFPWESKGSISGLTAAEEDQVADELLEHVESCLQHVKRSPWWSFLGCIALEPTGEEVALCILVGEYPERGLPREWDALACVVRDMVLKRVP
jgi:hypothetical protein